MIDYYLAMEYVIISESINDLMIDHQSFSKVGQNLINVLD